MKLKTIEMVKLNIFSLFSTGLIPSRKGRTEDITTVLTVYNSNKIGSLINYLTIHK